MSDPTPSRLADEIIELLEPVADGLENPGLLATDMGRVGLRDALDPSVVAALKAVRDLSARCQALAEELTPSLDSARSFLEIARSAFAAITILKDSVATLEGATSLGEDLAELLAGLWLARRYPIGRDVAVLFGLLKSSAEQEPAFVQALDGTVVRYPFSIDRFHFGRIVDLVRNPVAALKAEYASPLLTDLDANDLADRLFPRLQPLLLRLGVASRYGIHPDDQEPLGQVAPHLAHTLLVYIDDPLGGGESEAGFTVSISPASQGDLGLVVAPFGSLNFTRQVRSWAITAAASAGVEAFSWGRHGPVVLANDGSAAFDAKVTAVREAIEGVPTVFGAPDGTRLEVGGVELGAETHLSSGRQSLAFNADVTTSKLVLAARDRDSFVSSLIPGEGLSADFDLGLGWSSNKGLSLRGAAGLETTVPIRRTVAGVTLTALHLAVRAEDDRLEGELSASFQGAIGPVRATVERIGLEAALTFPDRGGNLGVADVHVGLKRPSGAGLAIDAHGVLSGGGFLSLDPHTGNYGGVVQLTLHEKLTLTGYGLIATRMPDGDDGYSLLVFLNAEDFKPIPLGFGFMLAGLGGMLGIHRTFDTAALRNGLKSGILSQLLFPRDPVRNAPALLQALAVAFPARQGSYLLGLLARITWFTPTLVQMDLALILELGARNRLLVLGRVSALLPSRDNDLIRLNLDALGVLDFDGGSLEADAVLTDSRIARRFPVTGSAALRARWPKDGASASFVLAAGGLNPRFAPPAGFPQLDRVAIALTTGRNPRLVCDAYFAITANTVQFGSRVALYAEAHDFAVVGDLGFDALINLAPLHFIVDFRASVQLKRGSFNLFKVTLDGTLEGPLPLSLTARATFEILWFSFTVRFDYTLAAGPAQRPPPSVRLEDEVRRALVEPANWSTRTITGASHGVTLRGLPAGGAPVLDPLGQLAVQQQVAPLNTTRDVDTFGGARVAGPRRFAAAAFLDNVAGTAVRGAFAPARYFQMSDDQKLLEPSFREMDCGFVLGDERVSFDPETIVRGDLEYDQFVLNPPSTGALLAATPSSTPYKLSASALQAQAPAGAAGMAPVRRVGRARFRNHAAVPAASLRPPDPPIFQTPEPAPSM